MKTHTLKNVFLLQNRKGNTQVSWYVRVALVAAVGMLQFTVFFLTYYLYRIIPYSGYLELETWFDRAVPYIEWSWIVYYFGFIYIFIWGAAGIWFMSTRALRRTIMVYVILVLTGGVLHLLFPSDSPWPLVGDLSLVQHGFKSTFGIQPLAGFPSMHAALAVLPAFIGFYVFRSRFQRILSAALATLVCISIITAKEHWAVDVPAGILLGLAAGWVWRRYVWSAELRLSTTADPTTVSVESDGG